MGHDPNRERNGAELSAIERLNAVTDGWPEVAESRDGFGHTVFKVGRRSLAILGGEEGRAYLALNVDRETQRFLIERGGFERTPYIGQHGWTTHEVTGTTDWAHIGQLLREAYRRIAPKRLAKQLPVDDAPRNGDPALGTADA